MTHPSYPTKEELASTRTPAIVALCIILATIITLAVMLTLQATSVASFSASTWVAVFFGGVIAVMLTGLIAVSKRRGRARNITDHPASGVTGITLTSNQREHFRNLRGDLDIIDTKESK